MGTLNAALAWAARGFRVFPIAEGAKQDFIIKNWASEASSDPMMIRAWWRINGVEQNYNIGCLTTGMVVVDIDVKDGKLGPQSFDSLKLEMSSLVVQTGSGGFHVYYDWPSCSNRSDLLGPGSGLDIRSYNGYVLAPGSVYKGGLYKVLRDGDIELLPECLAEMLSPPTRKRSREERGESNDSPDAIAQATFYLLKQAPISIVGESGNNTAYNVACKLTSNFGLSDDKAIDLLIEHWNPRCVPPWSERELEALVDHSEIYAKGDKGAETIAAMMGGDPESINALLESIFGDDTDEEPEEEVSGGEFGNALRSNDRFATQWIYEQLLIRKEVMQLVSAGAGGKSSTTLAIAAHGALGLDLWGYKLHDGAFKSIIYNAEDSLDEQSARLEALCIHYGFDFDEVAKGIMFLTEADFKGGLKLTEGKEGTPNVPVIRRLIRLAKREDVGMLSLDPLVKLHTVNENDSIQINMVMSILHKIAKLADIGLLMVHHTSKPGSGRQADDVNSVRGSSNISNSARTNFMLSGMSIEEAEVLGIPEEDRFLFSRLASVKTNYTLRSKPKWLKTHSVEVESRARLGGMRVDAKPVVDLYDIREARHATLQATAETLYHHMRTYTTAYVSLADAEKCLRDGEPHLYSKDLSSKAIRNRLESFFRRPVMVADGTELRMGKNQSGVMSIIMG
jgi:hypothetical protein